MLAQFRRPALSAGRGLGQLDGVVEHLDPAVNRKLQFAEKFVRDRLFVPGDLQRRADRRPHQFVFAQDLHPLGIGLGQEDVLDESDKLRGVFLPRIEVGIFRIFLQLRPLDGPAEFRPVGLRVGHSQHNPAVVLGRIMIADGIGHGFPLRAHRILSGHQTSGDIEAQDPRGGVVQGYLYLLSDAGALPREQRRHDARQEAQRSDAVAVGRPGNVRGGVRIVHHLHDAASRPEGHRVIAAGVLLRSLETVPRQIGIDELRIALRYRLIGQIELAHLIGPQVVQKHVGFRTEPVDDLLSLRARQVDADAFLVPVRMLPEVIDLAVLRPRAEAMTRVPLHIAATWGFHMDDFGPPAPHEHPGNRHGHRRPDLHDLYSFQCLCHIPVSCLPIFCGWILSQGPLTFQTIM